MKKLIYLLLYTGTVLIGFGLGWMITENTEKQKCFNMPFNDAMNSEVCRNIIAESVNK